MKIKSFIKYFSFGIYILALVWLVLLKFSLPSDVWFHRGINFVPFNISENTSRLLQLKEIAYNVIVFVPFGTYFSMIFKEWSFKKRLFAAFLMSLTFEIVQYILALGISDITDLITNTLGALIGIGAYRLLSSLFKSKADNVISITALIFEICFIGLFVLLILANH